MRHKLAFIGFGVVGQGLAKLLVEKRAALKKLYGFEYDVVAISDLRKGSAINADGLGLKRVLRDVARTGKLAGKGKGKGALETIADTDADIVIEVTYTNLETAEPALTHIQTALSHDKHVVTTNKGPIALRYSELMALAAKHDVQLRFEGTVLAGTPSLNLALEALAGASVSSIRGILNGTTNYILTEMERGAKYDAVLRRAQSLGYAEADPTADVDGWDALGKIVILANTKMGAALRIDDVARKGIKHITPRHIENAINRGKKLKLVAKAWRENDVVRAKVGPEEVPMSDILASVSGTTNALVFSTDVLGDVTVIGPGAGGKEAGYALLTDILAVHRACGLG